MGAWLLNILRWIDEGLNTIVVGFLVPILKLFKVDLPPAAGNAHYTVSQLCSELRERGSKFGCVACKLLTWMFKPFNMKVKNYDHCTAAMLGVPEDEKPG